MKALVHDGCGNIALLDRPRPRLTEPTDATVRVTRSTICTSDLHIMRGAVPRAQPDTVLGHEFVGVVEEVVNNCEHGGWLLGCTIDGCQAEYVRVPYADNAFTCIPDGVSDEDALFLGDILATGWWGARLAEIEPGSTVAVIGAGPVGLTTMMCARLANPAHIIALDVDGSRLELARERGLADVVIDPAEKSLGEVESLVRAQTGGRGADSVIEAAGGDDTFEMAWRIARPNAVVVISAMYERDQTLPLPSMYGKNLTFKTGGVDASGLDEVMALIAAGKLDTSLLVSRRYPLNDILDAYRAFEEREDGCLKVVITPWEPRG